MDSVFKSVDMVAAAAGTNEAFLFMDENDNRHAVSYAGFREDIHRAAGLVLSLSEKTGENIFGLLAGNSYDYIVSMLGIMGAGKTVVLLNTENSLECLEREIQLADLKYIFQDGKYNEVEPSFASAHIDFLLNNDDYHNAEPCWNLPEPDMDKLSVLLFTSGTTGASKGVMLSYRNVAVGVDSCLDYLERYILTGQNDMILECFPFYHVGGLTDCLSWIVTGKTMVINMDQRFFFRDMGEFPCTYISLVPAVLETIRKYFRRGKTGCIGGIKKILTSAAWCEPVLIEFFNSYGIEVHQLYGLSENTGIGLMNFSGRKYDSIGVAQKHVLFCLKDDEICLSGDAVMMGYLKNQEATDDIIHDGWLHTGDLGRVDDEGFVYITGRKKNLIILSSGENISPEELESLILANDKVLETVVREEGSKICAEIYCREDYRIEIQNHISAVNSTLPHYKHIGLVRFRSEPFQRTGSGKIKRK